MERIEIKPRHSLERLELLPPSAALPEPQLP
jgi:hypothetical protein